MLSYYDSPPALPNLLRTSKTLTGGVLLPINTAAGGICCTLNTRYDGMQLPEDILSLAHYPKTVILIEHYL